MSIQPWQHWSGKLPSMTETQRAGTFANDDRRPPIALVIRTDAGDTAPGAEVPCLSTPEGTPCLWTAWEDYYATGEGRILMACIAFARTADEMRTHFGKTFDPWYAIGCNVARGVTRNELTQLLWSAEVLDTIEAVAARGASVTVHSWLAWNFS